MVDVLLQERGEGQRPAGLPLTASSNSSWKGILASHGPVSHSYTYSYGSSSPSTKVTPFQTRRLGAYRRSPENQLEWEMVEWPISGTADNPDRSQSWRLCHLGPCQPLQEDYRTTVITQRVKKNPYWRWRQQGCTMFSPLSTYSCAGMKERPPPIRALPTRD